MGIVTFFLASVGFVVCMGAGLLVTWLTWEALATVHATHGLVRSLKREVRQLGFHLDRTNYLLGDVSYLGEEEPIDAEFDVITLQ